MFQDPDSQQSQCYMIPIYYSKTYSNGFPTTEREECSTYEYPLKIGQTGLAWAMSSPVNIARYGVQPASTVSSIQQRREMMVRTCLRLHLFKTQALTFSHRTDFSYRCPSLLQSLETPLAPWSKDSFLGNFLLAMCKPSANLQTQPQRYSRTTLPLSHLFSRDHACLYLSYIAIASYLIKVKANILPSGLSLSSALLPATYNIRVCNGIPCLHPFHSSSTDLCLPEIACLHLNL
ncbi:uncharacterized protein LOC125358714 [Perognathus longimembris pacificus]|uniref:uncharacterized protein LOC125358714 n=1 Tax=Perognathus longimembris pacificus TaxID=214514 RepID=UPI002019F05C|nr:uncharacterized protein LOC125358714 [Perognathus longimembris pacificus]